MRFLAMAAAIAVVAASMIIPLARMNHEIYIDYNEGWNAYHVKQIVDGRDLYQNDWTPVNYPPLFFYLSALLSRFLGDPLYVGRYIALLSLIGIALQVAGLVRLFTGRAYEPVFSGLFFLGLFACLAPHYVAMDDPQLLAQFVSLGGLLLYFKSPLKTAKALQAALALSVALFIKHNIVALPLAFAGYLYLYARRDFFVFLAAMAAFVGTLFGLTQLLSDGRFAHWIFMGREYSASHLFKTSALVLGQLIPSLWIVAAVARRSPTDPPTRLNLLYLLFALLVGVFFSGGNGTDVNIFFDLLISLSILAGLTLARVRPQRRGDARSPPYALTLAVFAGNLVISLTVALVIQHVHHGPGLDIARREAAVKADVAFIKRYDDPVLCERILLCYYAGRKFVYDPFLASQLVLTGARSEREILTPVEHRSYHLIQLQHPVPRRYFTGEPYTGVQRRHRFTENFLRALGAGYTLVRDSPNGTFYAPKPGAPGRDRSP